MSISAHQKWKRAKQSKAEWRCAALASSVRLPLGEWVKDWNFPGDPWEPRMIAGADLSSAAIGGAVARLGLPIPAAPLFGRSGGVETRTCAGPLRPLRWPGLLRCLTVRSVQHHGEAGQSGGEYPTGKTMGRRRARRQESGTPSSSRPGLRVSGGTETSSGETQVSPTSAPSPTPVPGARAPRTLLAPSGAPPTLSRCPLSSPTPTSPRLLAVLPGSLPSFPPASSALFLEQQELGETHPL